MFCDCRSAKGGCTLALTGVRVCVTWQGRKLLTPPLARPSSSASSATFPPPHPLLPGLRLPFAEVSPKLVNRTGTDKHTPPHPPRSFTKRAAGGGPAGARGRLLLFSSSKTAPPPTAALRRGCRRGRLTREKPHQNRPPRTPPDFSKRSWWVGWGMFIGTCRISSPSGGQRMNSGSGAEAT